MDARTADAVELAPSDYVIVGAGSAGCVLASRLSSDSRNRVTIIEAGGTHKRFFVDMPAGYGRLFFDGSVNWRYMTEPDPNLFGRQDYWPRGKLLGGSSAINAMVYIRGQREDFDAWEAAGNPGWGWRDVLPYFRKSEGNVRGADPLHGGDGPLGVSDIAEAMHPIAKRFLIAAQEAGLSFNDDFNGENQEGAGPYQLTIRNGRRSSTASAFLEAAMRRSNLRVVTDAHATRVRFENRRAIGVEIVRGNQTMLARAEREVIISAGAIGSPQLLMLSGIGPAEHLRESGVEVLANLQGVGSNLQDHVQSGFHFATRVPTLNDLLAPWWGKALVGARYLLTRGGPLALSINQAGAFAATDPDDQRPDVQLFFLPITWLNDAAKHTIAANPDRTSGYTMTVTPLRPTSRGRIALRSSDPLQPPAIHPNALATEYDREAMLRGLKLVRKIAAQPALASVTTGLVGPGATAGSDNDLRDYARRSARTTYHPSGTCVMGIGKEAVVNSELRVHGVDRVRVIDASIMPTIVSGNTNAAATMIGEKGADLVLADV